MSPHQTNPSGANAQKPPVSNSPSSTGIPVKVTASTAITTSDEELRKMLDAKGDDLGLMAVTLTRDVMDVASGIPYVKGIAGIIGQLLRIKQELRTHKDRCKELLDKVFTRSKIILEPLLKLKDYDGQADLKGLCEQLEEYLRLLEDVAKVLQEIQKRNFIQRVTNRGLDELNELDRKVVAYSENIIMSEVVQLRMHISQTSVAKRSNYTYSRSVNEPVLPPPPVSGTKERDDGRQAIIKSLLDSPNAKIAILGMGGMGKTTLACEVMRDEEVKKKYPTQLFVSFEGLTTIELVYTAFANVLSIPAEERGANIHSSIHRRLQGGSILLCCDNFETFWESHETRGAAEEFLGSISSFELLAIIVTLRGTQRPNRVKWAQPLLLPLMPLTAAGSGEILLEIAGHEVTEPARKLLDAVEGLPLAVTLIANILRDGNMTAESLWNRWCKQSTRAIENEGRDRQSNLDISITLSIEGPRLTATPDAKLLLAALAVLPDGLSNDSAWLESFQKLLPGLIDLENIIYILQNTALVTVDTSASTSRIRLLSPIRHFCLSQLSLENDVVRVLIALYTTDERMDTRTISEDQYSWISQELPNIRALLKFALESGIVNDDVGRASRVYTWWSNYLGLPSDDIIKLAIDKFSDDPDEKGLCLLMLGYLRQQSGHHEKALELLEEALGLHRKAGSKGGEAEDLRELGQCYRLLNRWDEATTSLESARKLYRELEEPVAEAYTLQQLAYVCLGCEKLASAAYYAKRALVLFQEHSNILGQANTHLVLAFAHVGQRAFERARCHLQDSLRLSEQVRDLTGQRNALSTLGDLYTETSDFPQAVLHYKKALAIAEKLPNKSRIPRIKDGLQKAESCLLADTKEKIDHPPSSTWPGHMAIFHSE